MKERITFIDVAKGIIILFVVIAHSFSKVTEYSIALKAPVRETGNQKSGC